ncbi:MAG: hypothetical protein JW986_11415 [Methanotrichaceae archaeon]|nr:hypothetical protein [Methanotrichaceae archaeon]
MKFSQKAIVFRDPEDVYGSCGCGMDMAILPVLLPKAWYFEECPFEVDDHQFCRGDDARRVSGFSCNNVFEHEMQGVVYLANFSCCRDCAQRAVEKGYAVWSEKVYPTKLR